MKMKKFYRVKSGDLIYRKFTKAKPILMYFFLLAINYIPKKFIHYLAGPVNFLKLKCHFTVLNRKLFFYIGSNLYDFKYHGGFTHELRISENILRLCPKDAVFFDIGAAVGWYSILLSQKCRKIYAFDPEDQSSLKSIGLNKMDNFEFFPYFISNKNKGEKVVTIDSLIESGFLKPNIIKIDVEGLEKETLEGAQNLLKSSPPEIILVETHSENLFYDCLKLLSQFNYQIYNLGCPKINTGGDIYPLSYDLNTDSFTTKSKTRMLLALKR